MLCLTFVNIFLFFLSLSHSVAWASWCSDDTLHTHTLWIFQHSIFPFSPFYFWELLELLLLELLIWLAYHHQNRGTGSYTQANKQNRTDQRSLYATASLLLKIITAWRARREREWEEGEINNNCRKRDRKKRIQERKRANTVGEIERIESEKRATNCQNFALFHSFSHSFTFSFSPRLPRWLSMRRPSTRFNDAGQSWLSANHHYCHHYWVPQLSISFCNIRPLRWCLFLTAFCIFEVGH